MTPTIWPALYRELLDPMGPGGHGRHRTCVCDVATDTPDLAEPARAAPGTVLVVDGIFLHRPELKDRWSWSIWLQAGRGRPCSAVWSVTAPAHRPRQQPPTAATSKASSCI